MGACDLFTHYFIMTRRLLNWHGDDMIAPVRLICIKGIDKTDSQPQKEQQSPTHVDTVLGVQFEWNMVHYCNW